MGSVFFTWSKWFVLYLLNFSRCFLVYSLSGEVGFQCIPHLEYINYLLCIPYPVYCRWLVVIPYLEQMVCSVYFTWSSCLFLMVDIALFTWSKWNVVYILGQKKLLLFLLSTAI